MNDDGQNEKMDKESAKDRERSKTFSSPKDRTNSPITRGANSPTLAELNSTHIPSSKRVALSPPYGDHHPVTTSILHSHLTSAVSDSFSNHSSPRIAFADKEGFDDLSASFKSLYKSIFGHSVSGGGDFVPPLPANSHGISVSSGLLGSSLPLGASASMLFSSGRNPQFISLMDSFRDIAETNSWDKLDPSQIQCLMDSFKEGEHHKYGLDPDTYADLHTSFNNFLSQLNNRFLTSSSGSTPRLSEYSQHQLGGAGGGVMSHTSMINHEGMPPPHHHPHHHHHHHHHTHSHSGHRTYSHPQTHPQIDSMLNLHQSSPPPSNYHSVNRTPSPHIAGMPVGASNSHAVVNPPYTGYVSPPSHTPSLGSLVGHSNSPGVPIQSAATDLFDEEDDFDWSKLM